MTLHRTVSAPTQRRLLEPAAASALLLCAALALGGCSRQGGAPAAAGGDATAAAMQANAAVAKAADLSDPPSFADAKRGFIAAPKGQVKAADGTVIWDYDDDGAA
jgi:alkyl sulfatase BDS1-like metallo-beta-lactamase superfamily hydrolase